MSKYTNKFETKLHIPSANHEAMISLYEALSELLSIYEGNPPSTGGFLLKKGP